MAPAVRHQQTGGRASQGLSHHLGHIFGKPSGDTVIGDKPQGDGGQQEAQAALDRGREHLVAGAVVLGQVPLGMPALKGLVLRGQLQAPGP